MTNAVASIQTSYTEPTHSDDYAGVLRSLIAKEPRRETLLRVARQEFATHGFLATTLSTIARLAGIRKSTIFHYFPTKEAIYEGAVTHKLDELAIAIEATARAAASDSAAMRIDAIVSALALAFAQEKPIARLFLRTMIEEPTASPHAQGKGATDRIVKTLAAAIRVGVDAGQVPKCSPMQDATSIVCVVCASHAALTRPSSAAGEEIDEPVLIGVSDAQRAAAIAKQVRTLLNIQS